MAHDRRYKIVILEDDNLQARNISGIAKRADMAISHCSTVDETIELLRSERVDLVIADIQLEEGDSLGLLSYLREVSSSAKIIYISQHAFHLDTMKALRDADEIFSKPLRMESFLACIDRLLPCSNSKVECHVSEKFERPSVFLSYSRKDSILAKRIAGDVREAGIDIWFDEWEIRTGDSICQRIQRGLQDANFVAVLLTRQSVKSGWVEKEWQSRIGEEAQGKGVIILPLVADSCTIPLLLRDKKYAAFYQGYESAINGLIRDIRSHSRERSPQ